MYYKHTKFYMLLLLMRVKMRFIFNFFCILFAVNLYGINHFYWILPVSITGISTSSLCASDETSCVYGIVFSVVTTSYPFVSSTDSTKSSVKYIPDRMYAKKYKKKYIYFFVSMQT